MRGWPLLLLPALLMAQRSAPPPSEVFEREMKRNRLGTWVVLEDEGAAWGGAARSALDEDPLVSLNLPLKVVSGGKKPDALAAILRDRFGWSKGARWALVDAKARVLEEGTSAPTVQALAAAAERAGVRSRAQELEDFLRHHPDHLEARVALTREYVVVANRRTRRMLGVPPQPQGDVPPPPPRRLDDENDRKIWGPVAGQLDRLFQTAWPEGGLETGLIIRSASAEHSPSMIALLTRHKAIIEDALRRRPNAVEPWMTWLQASQKCGGWPLLPLLQSLHPLPGTPAGEWPPAMAMNEFIKDAKARRDWRALREALEARWEDLKISDDRRPGGQYLWSSLVSPLVEALVSLGDIGAADLLLAEVQALSDWNDLPARARDLATRLNRPDLAARWGALTPRGR